MTFHEYPARPWAEILPRVSEDARDLVKSLLRYESAERLSAKSVSPWPDSDPRTMLTIAGTSAPLSQLKWHTEHLR